MLREVPKLYAATPAAIRAAIVRAHADAAVLFVVGHNPGISEFGVELAGRQSHGYLPTAGFWRLPFDERGWQALLQENARAK